MRILPSKNNKTQHKYLFQNFIVSDMIFVY